MSAPQATPLTSPIGPPDLTLTLVLDIGKSHAKLLMVDGAGQVVERHGRDNASVMTALGYPALDLGGLAQWITRTLRGSANTRFCQQAIASTHGAAVVALQTPTSGPLANAVARTNPVGFETNQGPTTEVAWEPLDYEFDGYANLGDDSCAVSRPVASTGATSPGLAARYPELRADLNDTFDTTLSPDLPAGLNIARQLFWLQNTHPAAWARTATLLPYAQFWAWWLSGVASSERSSLGCHTQLWNPLADDFSGLAQDQGWAKRFAPLRWAADVLGPVRPGLAALCGLPLSCQVHVGVHDSNACLARYLAPQLPPKSARDSEPKWAVGSAALTTLTALTTLAGAVSPGQGSAAVARVPEALTVVSSGTWTILMAPGAPAANLQPARDMLGNVDVLGRATPTARFMGGREFAHLLAGAEPDCGTWDDIRALIKNRICALPSFAQQGGPFMGHVGWVQRGADVWPDALAESQLAPPARAALAALYCAQVTAYLVQLLWAGAQAQVQRVVVEGPLAQNKLYLRLLQLLLPGHICQFSNDLLEGTARGAWQLAQGGESPTQQFLSAVAVADGVNADDLAALALYQNDWLAAVTKLQWPD